MHYTKPNRWLPSGIFIILLLWIISCQMFAQTNTNNGIVMLVRKNEHNNRNIINTVIEVRNNTNNMFRGYLAIEDIDGLKNISGARREITISPSDTIFLVSKFLQEKIEAGQQTITYSLFDNNNSLISTDNIFIDIPEKIDLEFSTESTNIFISNPNDSIKIKAYVENKGNRTQNALVVFVMPGISGNRNFTEKKITVYPSEKKVVELSFFPSVELLKQQQFNVNIYASYEKNKQIFGNTSIILWNVASEQSFQNNLSHDSDFYNSYSRNSLTLSYRQTDPSNYTVQAKGSGSLDLPVGYLDFRGNLYKMNNTKDYYMTNTTMNYRFLKNELSVGSINENMEVTMYGRGARIFFNNEDNSKRITAGIVDNEYNLLASSRFLSKNYGAYLSFQNGIKNIYKGLNSTLIYQHDRLENNRNFLSSNEGRFAINPDWTFTVKSHGAMSYIENLKENKFSGAAEMQYRGQVDKISMFGNVYWSSPYFPGNRKGIIYVTQTLDKTSKLKNSIRSNFSYFRISPKSYNYIINSYSQSIKADIGLSLQSTGRLKPSIFYQIQSEKNNSYNSFFNKEKNIYVTMSAHRLIEQLTWYSKNQHHLIMFTLENGVVKYPEKKDYDLQFKLNSLYLYKWLSVNATYQRGSYYLSEYALSLNKNKKYERFMLSTSVTKDFIKGKLLVNAGQNLMYDYISDFTPSFFANATYKPSKQYSFYINSSYYNYKIEKMSNNIFNFEVGVTINFSTKNPFSGKKGKLKASAYYDRNSNRKFDDGDTPATDYHLIIDKKPFSTNNEGQIVYKNLPFGKYEIKPSTQDGWFYTGDSINVSKHNMNIEIPLQQTGTVSGEIEFVFDKKKSQDTQMKKNDIRFHIKGIGNDISLDVRTGNDGRFTLFLPPGEYLIELNQNSLSKEMKSINPNIEFKVNATSITHLPHFKIEIKQRTVNLKKFEQ